MDSQLQIVAIVVSLGLFLIVFELVRRRRLLERYALLWLLTTFVLFGLSLWSGLLDQISRAVGIGYGPSTLFAIALGFISILLLHFSVVISRLAEQNKVLAQRLGLMQRQLDLLDPQRTDAETQAASGRSGSATITPAAQDDA